MDNFMDGTIYVLSHLVEFALIMLVPAIYIFEKFRDTDESKKIIWITLILAALSVILLHIFDLIKYKPLP
jgi:predicted permease